MPITAQHLAAGRCGTDTGEYFIFFKAQRHDSTLSYLRMISTFVGTRVYRGRTAENEANGFRDGKQGCFQHPTDLISTRRHLGPKISDSLLSSQ
jgi:hypothetical protein